MCFVTCSKCGKTNPLPTPFDFDLLFTNVYVCEECSSLQQEPMQIPTVRPTIVSESSSKLALHLEELRKEVSKSIARIEAKKKELMEQGVPPIHAEIMAQGEYVGKKSLLEMMLASFNRIRQHIAHIVIMKDGRLMIQGPDKAKAALREYALNAEKLLDDGTRIVTKVVEATEALSREFEKEVLYQLSDLPSLEQKIVGECIIGYTISEKEYVLFFAELSDGNLLIRCPESMMKQIIDLVQRSLVTGKGVYQFDVTDERQELQHA